MSRSLSNQELLPPSPGAAPPQPQAPPPVPDRPGRAPGSRPGHDFSRVGVHADPGTGGAAIVAMTVDLSTRSISIELDDGTSIAGAVASINLEEGLYSARWDARRGGLLIDPFPTHEQVIHFQVSGTHSFLRRYDALRRAIATPIPFEVVAGQAAPPPGGDAAPAEADETTAAEAPMMTFPLRMPQGLWRLDVAPITAWREGGDIVVSQPVNAVFANPMFRREVRTLPLSTFLGGVRLKPDQVVQVRLYDDDERVIPVTGEDMLKLSEATDTALAISAGMTVIDAASVLIPLPGGAAVRVVGRWAGRVTRPLATATSIAFADAAPVLAGRAAAPAVVEAAEHAVVAEGVSMATTRGVAAAAPQVVASRAAPAAAEAVAAGRSVYGAGAGQLAGRTVVSGTASAATHAVGAQAIGAVERRALRPIEGATEVRLTQAEFKAALQHTLPGQHFDQIASTVDAVGRRAAQRAIEDPRFVTAVQRGKWRLGGTLFHSAAAQEARLVPASALPAGWTMRAEHVIQAGRGGSRADLLLSGPNGQQMLYDWKTSGVSALSSSARQQMERHAGQLTANLGGTLLTQESRSWIDFVRPLLPGVRWP